MSKSINTHSVIWKLWSIIAVFLLFLLSSCQFLERKNDIFIEWIESSNETAEAEIGSIEPSDSITITLVSWNIRHLGRTKTEDDIYQIATLLRDFDIVAIQEVVAKDPAGAQAVAKIADELNRMGF